MKKKSLIFDFDGTIVDSMTRLTEVAAQVLSRFFSISAAEATRLYTLTSGLPFNEQVATLYPGHPNQKLAVETFEAKKLVSYFSEPLFDDALDTLQTLKEKHYFLAVSSSNAQHLVEKFVQDRLLPFDLALGWKPNFGKGAAHFQWIQQRENFKNDEMVFIGDSLKDAERALGCGIDFIGKTGTFTRQAFQDQFPKLPTIDSLAELKKIF